MTREYSSKGPNTKNVAVPSRSGIQRTSRFMMMTHIIEKGKWCTIGVSLDEDVVNFSKHFPNKRFQVFRKQAYIGITRKAKIIKEVPSTQRANL